MLKVLLCLALVATVAHGALLPINNCLYAMCTMDLKICADGRPAPIAPGECCPSLRACTLQSTQTRSNALLGSLVNNGNLLNLLAGATQGTDLGTVISILNLLHNVELLNNDVHQIPVLINQTLASLVDGAGEAGHIIMDQLVGAINNIVPHSTSRDLLGLLGQNANLLSGISSILPQGTSIATILSVLKLLSSINALNNDIHQIPVLLNQTLASVVDGAGQASQIIIDQLMSLVTGGSHTAGRDLLGLLGQNANLLSSVSSLLPQGTSIATVLSVLKLLSNINALSNDIHQIPVLLNETLTSLVGGVGEASQIIVQQLMSLVGFNAQTNSRTDILSVLGQNAGLLTTLSHLLPQGTSITTVISLLNLLNNINALNNDLHQIPVVLQETLNSLINGVQNLLPVHSK